MLQSPYPTLVILLTIHRICLIIFWHSQSAMLALNQNSLIKDIQRYSNKRVSSKSTFAFDTPGRDLRTSPSCINPTRDHVQPMENRSIIRKSRRMLRASFLPAQNIRVGIMTRKWREEQERGRERALWHRSLSYSLSYSFTRTSCRRASERGGWQAIDRLAPFSESKRRSSHCTPFSKERGGAGEREVSAL